MCVARMPSRAGPSWAVLREGGLKLEGDLYVTIHTRMLNTCNASVVPFTLHVLGVSSFCSTC